MLRYNVPAEHFCSVQDIGCVVVESVNLRIRDDQEFIELASFLAIIQIDLSTEFSMLVHRAYPI